MKLLSVNVGLPRRLQINGQWVATGIFKDPVAGRVMARRLNLDGDRQADLRVHGGEKKAVYAYPSEHYDYWRRELEGIELPWGLAWETTAGPSWGLLGENFTVEGLFEDQVAVGDRLRIGSALFAVTKPRLPCYKLAIKFGREDIISRFWEAERTGFYLSVLEEGQVGAEDEIEWAERARERVTIAEVVREKKRGE